MNARHFFSRPDFTDEEQTRLAGLLHIILLTIMLVATGTLVAGLALVLPQNNLRWVLMLLVIDTANPILIVANHRGHTKPAGILLLLEIWSLLTVAAFTGGGMRAPAVIGYLVMILIAGLLFGERVGIITGIVIIVTDLALALLEIFGVLPPSLVNHTPLSLWVSHVLMIGLVLSLQFLAARTIKIALRKAQLELSERKLADATLRQSEERYRSLVIATSEVVWTTNPEGEIIGEIPSWNKFTGQTTEQAIGRGWLNALHPDDREKTAEVWSRAVNTLSPYEIQYRLRRADGEWRHVSVRGVPVLEKNGAIREWVGFCKDITESKRTEQVLTHERDFSEAVINSLPGIFYVLDGETGFNLRWNKNAEVITEYSSAEIKRIHYVDFFDNADKPAITARVKEAFTTGHAETEATIVTKSGKHIPYFFTASLITLENTPCLVGVGIDISQRKQAEEQLNKLNENLERRVQERTAELDTINRELESFSYSVSHDLRAPLRAIAGFAQAMKEDCAQALDEQGRDFLARILDSCHRMDRLIKDLLAYSRIGRTTLEFSPVSLNDLLRQIAGDFNLRMQTIGAKLSVAENLPDISGDATFLTQIFTNLFENAINYRKQNLPLKLNVTSQTEPDHAIIRVEDNGVGIAPEYQEKIFQIFKRLHVDREHPGTGIGLATVRKSAETMGGQVWVESEPGKGSAFCVRLKLSRNS